MADLYDVLRQAIEKFMLPDICFVSGRVTLKIPIPETRLQSMGHTLSRRHQGTISFSEA